jgi:hypothetical protein
VIVDVSDAGMSSGAYLSAKAENADQHVDSLLGVRVSLTVSSAEPHRTSMPVRTRSLADLVSITSHRSHLKLDAALRIRGAVCSRWEQAGLVN